MEKNSSPNWLTVLQEDDQNGLKVVIDLSDENEELRVNPFDLPGDNERYTWLIFVDRLRYSKVLEMFPLPANDILHISRSSVNSLLRKGKPELKLIQ